MKKKAILLGVMLAVVLLVGTTACSAIDARTLDGIIQNVDSLSGNVTVTLNNGETMTFNLDDINLEDILAASDNTGLDCGDKLRIRMRNNGEVQNVQFRNVSLQGEITAIAGDNATVTVATEDNRSVTLKLTEETMVVIAGVGRTTVDDLVVGQYICVRYDKDTMTAEKIRVNDHQLQPAWQNREMKQDRHQEKNQAQQSIQNQEMNQSKYQEKHQNNIIGKAQQGPFWDND